MLYDYQFPKMLFRQSSWLLLTGPARAALTQGLISTLALASTAADAKSQGASPAKMPQDAATTEEPEVGLAPKTVDVPKPEPEAETVEEPWPEVEPEAETVEEPESETDAVEQPEDEAEPEPTEEPEPEPEPEKALEQEMLSKGFVFEDVVYDVENVEDIDGESHFMVPMLEISAKVTNTSDEKRDASDLPVLEFANKSEAFSLDSDFEGRETKPVSLSIQFGQSPDECVFSFSENEDKPAYTGLEGVGDELTRQLADAIDHLPDDQAELEADILEEQAELEAQAKLAEEAELEEEAEQKEQAESEDQQADSEQESEPVDEIGSESEPEPEAEIESEPELDPEDEAKHVDEPEAEPGPESDTEPEAEVESESKDDLEVDLGSESVVEGESEVELEPEPELVDEAEPELDPEPEIESEFESKPEAEADSEPVCWISSAGEKYHLDPNCRYVRGNELKEVSIAEAIAMGRTVCKGCDR